jgi:hypothetical protein
MLRSVWNRWSTACLLVVLGVRVSCAHEHWIDVDDFAVNVGDSVTVRVCSGHYFPKSSFALSDKVLEGVELLVADGGTDAIVTMPADSTRIGQTRLRTNGVSLLRCSLKRPKAKAPSYEAKTIIIAGRRADSPMLYAVRRGLEVVPMRALTGMKPGDDLPLVLLLDGQRVGGTLEVVTEGKGSSFLKTDTDKAGLLRLSRAGSYLVTANLKGRGCSLVFYIADAEKEMP